MARRLASTHESQEQLQEAMQMNVVTDDPTETTLEVDPVTTVTTEGKVEDPPVEDPPVVDTDPDIVDDPLDTDDPAHPGFQKRINQLTARNHDQQRRNDELSRQLVSLSDSNQRLLEMQNQPPTATTPPVAAPTLRDQPRWDTNKYESYDDYLNDSADYIQESRVFDRNEHQRELEELRGTVATPEDLAKADAHKAAVTQWNDGVTALKTEYDDVDEVFATTPPFPENQLQAFREAVYTHPDGSKLAYHLAKNTEELGRIIQLPPNAQRFEFGAVIAGLRNKPAAPADPAPAVTDPPGNQPVNPATARAKRSKAPDPIKPVGAPSTNAGDPSEMPYKEYREWRRANPEG